MIKPWILFNVGEIKKAKTVLFCFFANCQISSEGKTNDLKVRGAAVSWLYKQNRRTSIDKSGCLKDKLQRAKYSHGAKRVKFVFWLWWNIIWHSWISASAREVFAPSRNVHRSKKANCGATAEYYSSHFHNVQCADNWEQKLEQDHLLSLWQRLHAHYQPFILLDVTRGVLFFLTSKALSVTQDHRPNVLVCFTACWHLLAPSLGAKSTADWLELGNRFRPSLPYEPFIAEVQVECKERECYRGLLRATKLRDTLKMFCNLAPLFYLCKKAILSLSLFLPFSLHFLCPITHCYRRQTGTSAVPAAAAGKWGSTALGHSLVATAAQLLAESHYCADPLIAVFPVQLVYFFIYIYIYFKNFNRGVSAELCKEHKL